MILIIPRREDSILKIVCWICSPCKLGYLLHGKQIHWLQRLARRSGLSHMLVILMSFFGQLVFLMLFGQDVSQLL